MVAVAPPPSHPPVALLPLSQLTRDFEGRGCTPLGHCHCWGSTDSAHLASLIPRAGRSQNSKQHIAVHSLHKLGTFRGLGRRPKIATICVGSNFIFKTVVATEETETRFSCKIYRCSKAERQIGCCLHPDTTSWKSLACWSARCWCAGCGRDARVAGTAPAGGQLCSVGGVTSWYKLEEM